MLIRWETIKWKKNFGKIKHWRHSILLI
jgi:hypothetical protein